MNKALKTTLWVVGIGGVAYALYRFYRRQIGLLQQYDYDIVNVSLTNISKNQITLNLVTRFTNKSKIEATISKIFLDVYVEGQKVGFISENKPFLIPANGSSDIDMKLVFNPQLVLKNILGIIFSGAKRKDLKFTIKGKADIKSGFLKVVVPIDYSDVVSAYI